MSEDTRQCRTCGEVKPVSAFQRDEVHLKTGKPYPRSACKDCIAELRRSVYHSDPKRRALQVMYSMETAVKRKYPESWLGTLAREGAEKLLAAKCCSYCKMPKDEGQVFSLDHHVPLALGGLHTLENLYPCCEPCNRAKHDMPPADFKRWMDGLVFRLAWLRAQ